MNPERAAEVLRGGTMCEQDQVAALLMGAEALEFQGWVFGVTKDGWLRLGRLYLSPKWHDYPTFEDYARAEWEKERGKV